MANDNLELANALTMLYGQTGITKNDIENLKSKLAHNGLLDPETDYMLKNILFRLVKEQQILSELTEDAKTIHYDMIGNNEYF